MVEKGYLLEEPEDQHPLAWQRVIDPESGSAADGMATLKLWQQTKKHISAFPGRTKKIEGRQYLNFADYLKWRGRHAKGDRKSRIDRGLVVADWNEWVEQHGARVWHPWRKLKWGSSVAIYTAIDTAYAGMLRSWWKQ